jgi:hypothetical protein
MASLRMKRIDADELARPLNYLVLKNCSRGSNGTTGLYPWEDARTPWPDDGYLTGPEKRFPERPSNGSATRTKDHSVPEIH